MILKELTKYSTSLFLLTDRKKIGWRDGDSSLPGFCVCLFLSKHPINMLLALYYS